MRFENKSVIITGGGGKIGKAYAIGFAKEGARVALPDIASADHVVKAIRDMGGTALSKMGGNRLAEPETAADTGGDRVIELAASFLSHAELPGPEPGIDVFRRSAANRYLEVVNETGAVQRDAGHIAAFHQVDQDGREACLDDVRAESPQDAALIRSRSSNGSHNLSEVSRRENRGQRLDPPGDAGRRVPRAREIAALHLTRA